MPNYDELKKKAKDALDTIADVSVEAYKLAEEKAKVLAKKAKLNAEITHERAIIRRAKLNIGNAYYESQKDGAEGDLKLLCDAVTASLDLITGKQKELEDLKSGACCTDDDCCCSSDEENNNNENNDNQ